jgi:hypothetical protein
MAPVALVALLLLQAAAPAKPATTAPDRPTTTPAAKPATTTPAQPAAGVPAKQPPARATTGTLQPATGESWPRAYAIDGADVTVYRPQVASWADRKQLVAYSAVSYMPSPTATPSLGVVKFEADTSVSLERRLVHLANVRITETNFATLPKDTVRDLMNGLTSKLVTDHPEFPLDRLLANLDVSTLIPKDTAGLKTDPPTIFFSTTPAILVNFDSDPIWTPIKNNDLQFAVNTNWDVFQHEATRTFYLRHERTWLKATNIKGPWQPAGQLPASFSKLPADENFKDVKAAVPGAPVTAAQTPSVFVSTTPAELILFTGAPVYTAVPNTSLRGVGNTESDVFRAGRNGNIYYLVAGRWFSAADFHGPWTFASLSLPADFQKIPLEFGRSRVLASVPGTRQAAEAVLLAQVPQQARVNRKELQAPAVSYNGEPQFQPIETTSLQRAVNTDKDVIKVGETYYLCYQGVWFSGSSANGPWQVATTVPSEIYKIPPSSPVHNVTYVTVQDDDPNDEWVTYAYTAGYTGMMVGWGCAVWGSGWYYPPYYYGGIYYPYFPTYGYSAWYNPWNGTYGRGAVAYGPYGGVGAGARYNPVTGTYARGATAWGPYGSRGVAEAWNPRTGTYARTRQGGNVYGQWGSSYVQRGDDWARTAHYTNRITGNTTRAIRTDEGNVYAGRDGNVYRRQDGSWQQYQGGDWNSVNRPEATTRQQLDRDSTARTQGTQRSRDYGGYQRSGPTRSGAGSYRPRAGGGGRRR